MAENHALFEELRAKGHRITESRRNLIDFILAEKGHWAIQDMAAKAQEAFPSIGIATVYRTVNLLVEENALTKTQVDDGPARFEVTPLDHHDHLICSDCGLILEFEHQEIEVLQEKVSESLGFELEDHRMELFGRCREKQKKGRCDKKSKKRGVHRK